MEMMAIGPSRSTSTASGSDIFGAPPSDYFVIASEAKQSIMVTVETVQIASSLRSSQ
jgi:hypothetical protein